VRLVATALEGTPLDQAPLVDPCAVLLGTEGRGLPAAVVEAADARITIPMAAPVASLNVAVAAGIILYEARRQRMAVGGGR
jgi:tRNA G18 (ribose-2'-O)-methylase SpoU